MTTSPQTPGTRDPFAEAHARFGEMIAWLRTDAHADDHADLETALRLRGNELLRAAYQGHLDERCAREVLALRRSPPPGTEIRLRSRALETLFGGVVVRRASHLPRRTRPRIQPGPQGRPGRRPGTSPRSTSLPADAQLSLPPERYSVPLQEQAVLDVVGASYGRAREQLERATAGHIPHRQMLQVVSRAARDVETFDRERPHAANDTLSARALEVMSADGKGVRMRPEGLREETRKLAAQEGRTRRKGDPMAPRRTRSHDRRMAVVIANWEQEPRVRTPKDIVRDLTAPRTGRPRRKARKGGVRKDLPRPQNKRVRSSLVNDSRAEITEVFTEADRRDPERLRDRVMLVDGSESQMAQVRETARKLGVVVTIIVDVIHVLHYLWLLSKYLTEGDDAARESWVREHLMRLMTRPAAFVVSGLRQSATNRKLRGEDRKAVDDAVNYLDKNSPYLDYGRYLAAGMPIATGVIEGACRYLIQDRLGITGACWGLDGGEAVLKLRAVWVSGDWDAFWEFHRRQEQQRNYPVAKAA